MIPLSRSYVSWLGTELTDLQHDPEWLPFLLWAPIWC